jgi:hypothetical protein
MKNRAVKLCAVCWHYLQHHSTRRDSVFVLSGLAVVGSVAHALAFVGSSLSLTWILVAVAIMLTAFIFYLVGAYQVLFGPRGISRKRPVDQNDAA